MVENIIELAINEAKKNTDSSINNAQNILLKHLNLYPHDTEAWLLVIRLECGKSVEYADIIINYAQKILDYSPENPYALLFYAYAEYYMHGCSNDDLISKLDKAVSKDPEILSMVELSKAFYWKHRDIKKYEEALKLSIIYCSHHVTNYRMLGELYIKQGKIEQGKELIKTGLKNIREKVMPQDLNKPYDPTNIPDFLAEFFSGTRTNFIVYKTFLETLEN